MGRRSRRGRKHKRYPYQYLVHLYRNYGDASPCTSIYCDEIESGNYGFWIRQKKNGKLQFYDHVAYAMVDTLEWKVRRTGKK
jgi:hypothetical protein